MDRRLEEEWWHLTIDEKFEIYVNYIGLNQNKRRFAWNPPYNTPWFSAEYFDDLCEDFNLSYIDVFNWGSNNPRAEMKKGYYVRFIKGHIRFYDVVDMGNFLDRHHNAFLNTTECLRGTKLDPNNFSNQRY